MIHSIQVHDVSKSAVKWWGDVPYLKGLDKIEFAPGLNVIYGPNGSGKSTMLKLIARMMLCEQGDIQKVSYDVRDLFRYGKLEDPEEFLDGVIPIHDGAPVMHFDPSQRVGLVGGAFDYDFLDAGLTNTMLKASAGQTSLVRMQRVLGAVFGGDFPKFDPEHRSEELMSFLAGNLPEGVEATDRPTVLLDEPSRSLDLRTEIRFFERLAEVEDVQIILATHSTFALHLPGANYVETYPRYVKTAKFMAEIHFLKALRNDPERLGIVTQILDEAEAEKAKEVPDES